MGLKSDGLLGAAHFFSGILTAFFQWSRKTPRANDQLSKQNAG